MMGRSNQNVRKKSDQVEFSSFCGCCTVGLASYPTSIEDFLSTDSYDHGAFRRNFVLFLKLHKDENVGYLELKHEQRLHIAEEIASAHRDQDHKRMRSLAEVGKNFMRGVDPVFKWKDDLLEGFDGAETLSSHLKDLYIKCDSNIVVKEDLVASAYSWLVEQLDVDLQDFILFREGLREKERGKWDRLVNQYNEKISEFKHENLGVDEQIVTRIQAVANKQIVDMLYKMCEIISQYKNQGIVYEFEYEDIDALVESIEGKPKPLGAVLKKPKENSSKSKKKRKNQDTKGKNGQSNTESLTQGREKSQQEKENVSHGNKILVTQQRKNKVTLDDTTEKADDILKTKETVSSSAAIAVDLVKTKRTVSNRSRMLDAEPEKMQKAVLESTRKTHEPRNAKETVSDSTKISDELRKTVEKLDDTKTRLWGEELKNLRLNDKLTSAYQEIHVLRTKIIAQDHSDEAKNRLREEVLKNSQLNEKLTYAYQENNLLRINILQSDFKKFRNILRQRLQNNLSVIDHLRASPDLDHTPQIQLALSSLHEFSARLMLAEQELTSQYAALFQQSQTSNIVQELQFDMTGVEPPELGSSYLNLLHRAVLMNHPTTPQTYQSSTSLNHPTTLQTYGSSSLSSHLLPGSATSSARDVEGEIFSRIASAGNQERGPSLAYQVNDSGFIHHEEDSSLIRTSANYSLSHKGASSIFYRLEDDPSFIQKGATSRLTHQRSGPSSQHEEKPCLVRKSASSRLADQGNGLSSHHEEKTSLTRKDALSDFSRQGSGVGFSRQGSKSSYSSQGPDPSASLSLQKAGLVDTFPSKEATASPYPPGGASASSSFRAEAAASSFHQADASASSSCPTRAEKQPNTTKAKKAIGSLKGSGGGASLDLKDSDNDCSICFEEMHYRDSFYLKNCWHRFHRTCINQWMESTPEVTSRSTCPICRMDIK